MMCLKKLDLVSDVEALASIVFPKYLALAKRLQKTYMLEPAGSHGVWSLDDYHLLPFVLGAAQLDGNVENIRVKSIRSEDVLDCYRDSYMYFNAVYLARNAKTGAPFKETCPMLYVFFFFQRLMSFFVSILCVCVYPPTHPHTHTHTHRYELSKVRCGWKGLCERLLRMFAGEVMGKFPVAQHILFGELIPATWTSSTSSTTRRPAAFLLSPSKPVLNKYFGDVVASSSNYGTTTPKSRFPTIMTTTNTTTKHEILTNGIRISGWKITSHKDTLSGDTQMKEMERKAKIDFPFPEMTFGSNFLKMEHEKSGISIMLEPSEALRGCKLNTRKDEEKSRCKMVKVPCADKWKNRVDAEGRPIESVSFNYDWTYTTFYQGHLDGSSSSPSSKEIDYAHLRRRDPILWNDDVVLFEAELDDNGTSELRAKIRVMPTCFFCLLRLYVRVDRVLLRVFDTRIYHRFGENEILLERSERERPMKNTERPSSFKDPNTFTSSLPLIFKQTKRVSLLSKETSSSSPLASSKEKA